MSDLNDPTDNCNDNSGAAGCTLTDSFELKSRVLWPGFLFTPISCGDSLYSLKQG